MMIKNHYNVIGVMSGTSLDGIDLAYIKFTYLKKWKFEILQAETIPYSQKWIETLKNLVSLSRNDLLLLDDQYTQYLAQNISHFIPDGVSGFADDPRTSVFFRLG